MGMMVLMKYENRSRRWGICRCADEQLARLGGEKIVIGGRSKEIRDMRTKEQETGCESVCGGDRESWSRRVRIEGAKREMMERKDEANGSGDDHVGLMVRLTQPQTAAQRGKRSASPKLTFSRVRFFSAALCGDRCREAMICSLRQKQEKKISAKG